MGDPVMDYLGGATKRTGAKHQKMGLDLDSILGIKVPRMGKPLKPLLGKQHSRHYKAIPGFEQMLGSSHFKAHKPTRPQKPFREIYDIGIPMKGKMGSFGSMTDMVFGTHKKKQKKKRRISKFNNSRASYIKCNFANYESQKAAFQRMKENGTYDPRKDTGSQLNRTGTPTKEERRWIKYQDSGRQDKSPYEIMHPPSPYQDVKPVIPFMLSDVESARLEKLKNYRKKLKNYKSYKSNPSNEKTFNDQYSDENLIKIAKHFGEMTVGIDSYNPKDKKSMDYIRERIPPDKRTLFDQSPKAFIDARLRYEGTWVPQATRSREQQQKADRRKKLEKEYPDAISYWIPARMMDDGDFESTLSIERRHDGSFNLKDLHNSQGGAWHSGKYLAQTRSSRHPDFYNKELTTDEIRNHLRKEIVGVVEVAQVGSATHTIESLYGHLKPGERETLSMKMRADTDTMGGKGIYLQTISTKIGQMKPADIKKEIEYIKGKIK